MEVVVDAVNRRQVEKILRRRGYKEEGAKPGPEGQAVTIQNVRTRDGEIRPAAVGGPAEWPVAAGGRPSLPFEGH